MEAEKGLVKDGSNGTRERNRKTTTRQTQKTIRYSDHFPNLEDFERPCQHHNKRYNCMAINEQDIITTRKKLYAVQNRVIQNIKISYLLTVAAPKKRKNNKNVQNVRIGYKFWDCNKIQHNVCQKFFRAALHVSQRRIITISKQMKNGEGITEKRGGDRRSKRYKPKRYEVIKFIGSLKGSESHYNRNKSKIIYLAAELSISKLYKMYNNSVNENLQVKRWFFFKIFNSKFNIGFGSPASDVCSFCYTLKNQIKMEDASTKNKCMMELRLHKLSAKQFNLIMNNNPENSFSLCFDLQQVQVLPKLPIQEAYYASQLALYNFCITDIKTLNPTFYTWMETQAGRGPNEIGSALYNFLSNYVEFPEDCSLLRLFCDGCSGQNKNSMIVHMLMYWLANAAPRQLKTILLVFPVRGHTFLPAVRVFGRIEKIARKRSEILLKEDYWQIFEEVGNIKVLGSQWNLHDMKDLCRCCKKLDGIRDAKRIYIEKNDTNKMTVRLEQFYRNDVGVTKCLLKKGKSLKKLSLKYLELGRSVKEKKLKDVDFLLDKCYSTKNMQGEKVNWRNREALQWYKELIDSHRNRITNDDESDSNEECDCEEGDSRLRT